MVFDLILDVMNGFWRLGDTHTESAITFFSHAHNLGRDPFNRPAGRGYFPHNPRHFVPGYYQPVPPGQKPFGPRAPRLKLTRMGARPDALPLDPPQQVQWSGPV